MLSAFKHRCLVLFAVCLTNISYASFFISSESKDNGKFKSQILFKENKGQITDQNGYSRSDILFSTSDGQVNFYYKKTGVSYQLYNSEGGSTVSTASKNKSINNRAKHIDDLSSINNNTKITIQRIDINWLNTNNRCAVNAENVSEYVENYYTSSSRDISGIKAYSVLKYVQLYNGIDVKLYENGGNLKYDYLVAANTDYHQIKFSIEGCTKIEINKSGELILITPNGSICEKAPLVMQNGYILPAKWVVVNNIVSFSIDNINPALPFVIDPLVRLWGTYYGGSNAEEANYCSTDINGNVYLAGNTRSLNQIATVGAHQTVYAGGTTLGDAFVVKFNSAGARQWATYYGGSGDDNGNAVRVDNTGNVYLVGGTGSASGISTPLSHQPIFGGGSGFFGDGYVVKFNASGIRQWATYYGGAGDESIYDCSFDINGFLICTGVSTATSNAISTLGSHQPSFGGGISDGFVVKFDLSGNRIWATYYGGTMRDDPYSCETDASGNIYIGGTSTSTNGTSIASVGAHQTVYGGGAWGDAFVAKFNSAGVRQWGTYYGGVGDDYGIGCSVNSAGDVFIIGATNSTLTNVIATPGSHQTTFGGSMFWGDGFLAKFNSSGIRQWGTYYGDAASDNFFSCKVDAAGNIYVAGQTSSNNSISTPFIYQTNFGGSADAYLAKFDGSGNVLWATYYGGTGIEDYIYCYPDPFGNIYLSGSTATSTGTIVASAGSHQPNYGGGSSDAFLVKFNGCIPYSTLDNTPLSNLTICSNSSTTLIAINNAIINWYSVPVGGTSLSTGSLYVTPTLTNTTTYYIEDLTCGITNTRVAVTVTVQNPPAINIVSTSTSVCSGSSLTLVPQGAISYTWYPNPTLNSVNSPTATITPFSNTTYSLVGTNGVCTNTALINITVLPNPTISINSSSPVLCLGSSLQLTASGAQTYSWFPVSFLSSGNGATVSAFPITNTTYTVIGANSVNNMVCTGQNLISLNVIPVATAQVSGNTSVCFGQSVTIFATGGNTFNWSPTLSINNPFNGTVIASPASTTIYTVNVSTNNYCGNSATIAVNVNPNPAVYAGSDTTFYFDELMLLNASGTGTLTWVYGEGILCSVCPNSQILPQVSGCYIVEAINNNGCKSTDEVCVTVIRENDIYVPNCFTPNKDGLNDVFYIYGVGIVEMDLKIYNRFGNIIFSSQNQLSGWNGFYKNELCPMGSYIWSLKYTTLDGKKKYKEGYVTLLPD